MNEFHLTIKVDGISRKDAARRLAPFLENPRNPNLLPVEAKDFGFIYLTDTKRSNQPLLVSARSYCSIPHCNNKLAHDSGDYCEDHYCRQNEADQLIWRIWYVNVGYDAEYLNLFGKTFKEATIIKNDMSRMIKCDRFSVKKCYS